MKKFISAGLLFFSLQVFAQNSFEGKVTYKFLEAAGKKKMGMEVYFGKQKIKAVLQESDSTRNGKDDLLLDLANGIVHHLNSRRKTYYTDNLNNNGPGMMPAVSIAPEKSKTILDHHSTAYAGQDTAKSDFMGPMNFTIWYADSLYFPFDKKYATTDMVPMFGNGSTIAMGMQMDMGQTSFQTSFEITPVSIEAQSLPDSIFMIPADFVLSGYRSHAPDSVAAADSAVKAEIAAVVDSVKAMVDVEKVTRKNATSRSTPKKSSRQNTGKQPAKTAATKPKG